MAFDMTELAGVVEVLKHPSPRLRLMTPQDADFEYNLEDLYRRLITSRLYMSDELRTEEYAKWLVRSWFAPGGPLNLVYRVGTDGGLCGGVMAFQGILPGWKCGLMAKIWERKLWGAQLAREVRCLLALVEKAFGLERIEIDTADLRMVRLGRLMGFDTEGVRVRAFRWNGEPFDVYELARINDERMGVRDGE